MDIRGELMDNVAWIDTALRAPLGDISGSDGLR